MKRYFLLIFVCFIASGCSESPIQKAWKAKQKALVSWISAYTKNAEVWETIASYLEEIANAWEENPEAWEAYADTVSQENDSRAFLVWQDVKNHNTTIRLKNYFVQKLGQH